MPGVYGVRVRAAGLTPAERPFTHEQTLTGSITLGGGGTSTGPSDLCRLLECLLGGQVVTPAALEALGARGLDWKALPACLRRYCQGKRPRG